MQLSELDEMIKAICPIDGISCDGRIDFKPEATPEQRAMAYLLMQEKLSTVILERFP